MEIRILEYISTVLNRNHSTVIATVKYRFNGIDFERTFVRDLTSNLSTREYLKSFHA